MSDKTPGAAIVTGKAISRRTVLRGFGAALALPYLDAMNPAFSVLRAPAAGPIHRFQACYVPNGMAMPYWTPATVGKNFELTPILEPLASFKDQTLVLSGLKANWNIAHAGASGSFLTGTTRGGRNEMEILADVSVDQLLARKLGAETQLSSLELSMDAPANAGACTIQPELRLHPHDFVAQRNGASAHGIQSAGGVREAVWRQWEHGARGAGGPTPGADEHSRRSAGKAVGAEGGAW